MTIENMTRTAEVDHFVITTRDIDRTVDDLHRVLGVCPVEGGVHLDRGSWNYLLGLGGKSYLEIIAIDPTQPEPSKPRMFALDNEFGPSRLMTWAVRADGFDESRRAAAAAGFDLGTVSELRRPTPDGELSLHLTERANVLADGTVPFLVDWGNTPHPAATLPQVPLASYRLAHPHPRELSKLLATIGVNTQVTWATTPAIELDLSTPEGIVVLR